MELPRAVEALAQELRALGWVTEVFVGGSLATGDYRAGVSDLDVRRAAQAELTGYWAMAVRRPWWWLDSTIADLGLTSMARGRYALEHGRLLTKTSAIDLVHAPQWLRDELRARREGRSVSSPRLATAWFAWCDARRTTRLARRRR